MLVISRRIHESVQLGDSITVQVCYRPTDSESY
jgi:sRNA-binding carbon storage regulator CsrA